MKKLLASLALGLTLGLGFLGTASVASAQTAPAAVTAPAALIRSVMPPPFAKYSAPVEATQCCALYFCALSRDASPNSRISGYPERSESLTTASSP